MSQLQAGAVTPKAVYAGSVPAQKVYVGSELLWQPALAHLTGVVYSQSNVYTPQCNPADYAGMNNGNADGSKNNAETGLHYATGGTNVAADTGAVHWIDHLVIGYDYLNNLPGGWGAGYLENQPIDASTDNTAWTQIGTTPTYASTGSANGLAAIPINGNWRSIRIGPHNAQYLALLEFELWGGPPAPPAPAWATTAASGPTGSNSVVGTVPSGVAVGDIIMAFIVLLTSSPVVVTPPAGWTEKGTAAIGSTSLGAIQSKCFWKRATGNDTGSYTFGLNASYTWVVDIMRYTGCVASGDPIDAYTNGATNGALQTTTPPLALTTTAPNRRLVWFAADPTANAASLTPPSAFTNSEWVGSRSKVVDTAQAGAGNTGTVQGTTSLSGGDGFTSWLVALKP